jgi:lysophospholipase L1-like esterase
MVKHLRARTDFWLVSWVVLAHLVVATLEGRTHAQGVTGNVVFAGDALAAGVGAAPEGSLSAQCLTILGTGWKGRNSGAAGRTARQILDDYEPLIGRHLDRSSALNVLVLWQGGDDLVAGTPPDEVADNLARIAARARSTGFDRIILLTSTPRSKFPDPSAIAGTRAQQRHTYINRRADLDARLLALNSKFDGVVSLHTDGQVGVDGAETNPVYFAGDHIHLNDRGYLVVAALVAERIQAFAPRRVVPGQSWTSPRGNYHLILQPDGNLVLYGPQRKALWATDTQGQPTAEAMMQPDGNLVLYGPEKRQLWSSGNGRKGADLRVQDDGNVVIYQKGNAVWSPGTGTWNRPRDYKPPPPPSEWKEHWKEHNQHLRLVAYNDDVALYFDRDMPHEDVRWLLPLTTRIWQYTKKTYGDFGTPDDRLFAIFHQGRYGGGHPSTYFASDHDDRNVSDIGLKHCNRSEDGYIIHEVSHIVEGASNGVKGSPAFGVIWGDSKWAEFFQYDLRVGTGQVWEAEAALRRYTDIFDKFPRPGSHWFRDFFYPLWRNYGHSQAMVNYFRLLAKHYPKETYEGSKGLKFSRADTNWGEFIHFLSGAAAVDLRPLATQAFGWPQESETQFQKARAEFPGVIYPK